MIVVVSCLTGCSVFKCQKKDSIGELEGTWNLTYITGPRIAFEGLFPNRKPFIRFDVKEQRVSGNNSCNSYTGKLVVDGNTIDFTQPMAVTKMMCLDGNGEETFMTTLQKVNKYKVADEGKALILSMDDVEMMRLSKE